MPAETLIRKHQDGYHAALQASREPEIDAAVFIDYMFDVITESLTAYAKRAKADATRVGDTVDESTGIDDAVRALLRRQHRPRGQGPTHDRAPPRPDEGRRPRPPRRLSQGRAVDRHRRGVTRRPARHLRHHPRQVSENLSEKSRPCVWAVDVEPPPRRIRTF
ncbi:hypothetical protein [Microlunatus parietis]|uniref:Uncharacterized protein n=1 Tax=Microlunatus parietis TaxID=682979 RepID=A0A7Y9IC76_9ACTN|nr:hypothetical protein [Microlunatus parietis]NYE74050.1 hypothetical protein [Microlunatus parietis]